MIITISATQWKPFFTINVQPTEKSPWINNNW
jgi:hypothetical protein